MTINSSMRRRTNQQRKDDKALFTIKFESSSAEESCEEEPAPAPPPPEPAPRRPPPTEPVKVTTQKVSAAPINFVTEYSEEEDESSANEDAMPKPADVPEPAPAPEVNEDVFTLQEDSSTVESPSRPPPQPRPVDASFPKRITPIPKPDASKTYVIAREKLGMLKWMYVVKQGETELPFYGKAQKAGVGIYSDKQMKGAQEYILMIANDSRDFSLRRSPTDGHEIMVIRFTNAKPPVDNARRLAVFLNAPKEGTPAKLTSKNPRLNPDGVPVHEFRGRFAIDSVKNAVLVASADGPPAAMIRKIGNEALEIDIKFPHEPIWAFAIGIASFVTKTK